MCKPTHGLRIRIALQGQDIFSCIGSDSKSLSIQYASLGSRLALMIGGESESTRNPTKTNTNEQAT